MSQSHEVLSRAKRRLSKSLRLEMKRARVSQSELARRMGTGRSTVHRLLNPNNTSITLKSIAQACASLGVYLICRGPEVRSRQSFSWRRLRGGGGQAARVAIGLARDKIRKLDLKECPGPVLPSLVGPLLKHHTEQWEKTGKRHWWRWDWDHEETRCKFCGQPAPPPSTELLDNNT